MYDLEGSDPMWWVVMGVLAVVLWSLVGFVLWHEHKREAQFHERISEAIYHDGDVS